MRTLVALLIGTLALASPSSAYTVDEMWAEFDASDLNREEKRFLQMGLALTGHYAALIDGAWGSGSQNALVAWASANELEPPIENWETVYLALDTQILFDAAGWQQRYFEPLDMSFAVPTAQMREEPHGSGFLNFAHIASSLRYSLTVNDLPTVAQFHGYALSSALAVSTPYTLRRDKVWITSVEQPEGAILYVRSDLRRVGWSSVILSAHRRDQNLLNAAAASITKGKSSDIYLPERGALSEGVVSLATIMAEIENQPRNPDQDYYAMREGMTTAPTTVPTPQEPVAAPSAPTSNVPSRPERIGNGTAFLVSEDGHLLTNAHVVSNCETLKIDGHAVELMAADENFDLALLKAEPASPDSVAAFSPRPAPLNADITIAGYPLSGLLSGLNVTRGSVTSLKGLAGDATTMQISAPVQPGNSGGPAVDSFGNVVGVVVSKLDAQLVADAIGDIPQNVNFAVRGEIAKLFMFQNGVEPVLADSEAEPLRPEDAAEKLEEMTRLVECYGIP